MTEPLGNDTVDVFRDDAGEFRWHRIAANNEKISTSGEGFVSYYNAMRACIRANRDLFPDDGPGAA